MAKIPENIFRIPELVLEEEEPPPLWVVRLGATSGGREVRSGSCANCRAKWLMCNFYIELLMCHHLNHSLNILSKSTRSLRVDGNVPYLIHDVVKHIKLLILHGRFKQVPLISRNGV
jgi:hypothetical protein